MIKKNLLITETELTMDDTLIRRVGQKINGMRFNSILIADDVIINYINGSAEYKARFDKWFNLILSCKTID